MRSHRLLLTLPAFLLVVECTPPYPTPRQIAGPFGLIRKLPDPGTIKAGQSRSEDVRSAFKEVDTGIVSPWFFWARWKRSSAAVTALTDSGLTQIPFWSAVNLLVEFDDTGTVKNAVTISDQRVISELQRIVALHPEPIADLPARNVIAILFRTSAGGFCSGHLALSGATVEFSGKPGSSCPAGFSLAAASLTIGSSVASPDRFNSGFGSIGSIPVTLRFSIPTSLGEKITPSLPVKDLVSMLRFLEAKR
jgi:hypothetical protein